jgi:hypothetical protein
MCGARCVEQTGGLAIPPAKLALEAAMREYDGD